MTRTIDQLKQLTLTKNINLSDCMDYFLDLSENIAFLKGGQLLEGDDSFFRTLLVPMCEFFDSSVKINSLLTISMKPHHFVHGTADLSNNKMVVFYYFEDIQCGVATAARIDGKAQCFRITLINVDSVPMRYVVH